MVEAGQWEETKRKLCENETISSRSEKVISVKCSKEHALLSSEFRPKRIPGVRGVYISRAVVSPDVNGHFLLTVLNVNDGPVNLRKRQVVGMIDATQNRINRINVTEPINVEPAMNVEETFEKCVIGDNLSDSEAGMIKNLLKKHAHLFASNPKKPNQTSRVEHRILTGDSCLLYTSPSPRDS